MITGSVASSFHGEPRTTRDVDIVIDASDRALDALLAQLSPAEWYVDANAARSALRDRTQFNVIHVASAWKIDLIVRKERAFSLEEFRRRREVDLAGVMTVVASAEDTAIAKLEWAAAGESERQLRDVAAIIAVIGDDLDRAYIERWVARLDLRAGWHAARELAERR